VFTLWLDRLGHYFIAGKAVKVFHNSRPGFQNLMYCDGDILIGDGHHFETMLEDITLLWTRAMVLSTAACKEKKFTWCRRQSGALGLMFDFDCLTVAITAP
jgi:hypothetical protein